MTARALPQAVPASRPVILREVATAVRDQVLP